jgi:TorA maturation chaperone TorD
MVNLVAAHDAGGNNAITGFLADLPPDCDFYELAGRLAVEHTRLFGGIREGYGPPPPYESLWREGQVMGETAVAVACAYREAEYQPGGDGLPLDHVAEELRFVAALCNGEHEAMVEGRHADAEWARDRQSQFIGGHLVAWVPAYCESVARASQEPFFQALARATADALAEDACRLLGAPAV